MTQENSKSWFVIINPTSGKGKGLREWPIISGLLYDAGISFEPHFTQRKFHAIELTFQAARRGFRSIIVVGGDGTLHEAACGVMMQNDVASTDITLALFAVGTGNDWMRMYGIPKTYNDIVGAIKAGKTFLQDVAKVQYTESLVEQTSYLINVGGVAYDAAVCASVNRLKSKGYRGTWLYIRSAFTEAIKFRSRRASIKCDGKEIFSGRLFSATIAIGKYSGGGLSQTPLAVADDGLLDMTLIPQMNRVRLFMRFKALYNDNIYNINGVSLHRGTVIEITSNEEIPLELDGENMGVSDFRFQVIERAIRVIVR
ncbi:MAG: diacylglycerol kinase family lipid kinase [Rikenellaceae bacterium]